MRNLFKDEQQDVSTRTNREDRPHSQRRGSHRYPKVGLYCLPAMLASLVELKSQANIGPFKKNGAAGRSQRASGLPLKRSIEFEGNSMRNDPRKVMPSAKSQTLADVRKRNGVALIEQLVELNANVTSDIITKQPGSPRAQTSLHLSDRPANLVRPVCERGNSTTTK